MIPILFILFPIIIFAFLLVVLIIWAIAKSGKARKGIGIVFAIITFIVLTRQLVFARISRPVIVQQTGNTQTASESVGQPVAEISLIWHRGMEEEFEADIYPSMPSAARAIGRQLAELLPSITAQKQNPSIVQIWARTEKNRLNAETLYALAEGLKSAGDIEKIMVETILNDGQNRIESTDKNAATINVSLVEFSYSDPPEKLTAGTLKIDATAAAGRLTRTARFTEKPWIDNFAAFMSGNPNGEFIVARSTGSCTSYEQADNQALSNACRIAAARLNTIRPTGNLLVNQSFSVNPQDIKQFGFIKDSFVQTFSGSVSPIYRKAVLLDLSRDKIQSLANQKFSLLHSQRATWFKMILSLAGIIALICVVYLFLNAATKGYYTWALRIVAIVLTAIFVLILIK